MECINKAKGDFKRKTLAVEPAAALIPDEKIKGPNIAAKAILGIFSIKVTPQAIGQMKKSIIDTCKQSHEERVSKRVKHIRAVEMFKGGLRKKVRLVQQNTVLEDHREGLADWIK